MKPRFNNEANDFNDGEKLNRCSFARYTRRCQKTRDRMCVSTQNRTFFFRRRSDDEKAAENEERRKRGRGTLRRSSLKSWRKDYEARKTNRRERRVKFRAKMDVSKERKDCLVLGFNERVCTAKRNLKRDDHQHREHNKICV